MEHSIHLGAGYFIEGVSPTSTSAIVKKTHAVSQNILQVDDGGDEDDNGDSDDSDDTFDVGDAVGKGLALVKQVCDIFMASFINFI